MENADEKPEPVSDLQSREPSVEDLVELCRHLNESKARYIVIGGFAMRAAGYDRHTMDVDLLIDVEPGNERRVFTSLEHLPDQAVKELDPGDVAKYTVVRIADEIVVDLMKSACGIEYEEAFREVDVHRINGVEIPFASPALLIRMKQNTHREKDALDMFFLSQLNQT
ncbi:MAG: nucleotidyltransferase [Kiritimatiellia bacterium]